MRRAVRDVVTKLTFREPGTPVESHSHTSGEVHSGWGEATFGRFSWALRTVRAVSPTSAVNLY